MIVLMQATADAAAIDEVVSRLSEAGFSVRRQGGEQRTLIEAIGLPAHLEVDWAERMRAHFQVEDVVQAPTPHPLVAISRHAGRRSFAVGDVTFGGTELVLMAGPCTVESEAQLMETAEAVAQSGATVLRGGAFKPTTSPYSFQGLGRAGLELLREAGRRFNLLVVTEVMSPAQVPLVAEFADIMQIGTRNMQNFDLLREVGASHMPVLLKRGMSARYEEWLLAAEYVATSGSERIILCERGVRSFETGTRNMLDIAAVPVMKSLSHLPIVVDPSQGTGRRELVAPMACAAVAAGADGLLIEVHPDPENALKDGRQSVATRDFAALAAQVSAIGQAIGRRSASRAVSV